MQSTFCSANASATLSKLGHRLWGGLVSEVAFGADRLRSARTKPVTYCRGRREKPLDAERGHDSAGVSARLERYVGLDLTEEKNRLTRSKAMIRPE
jgi:hypothetical protein